MTHRNASHTPEPTRFFIFMNFDKNKFRRINYGNKAIYFDTEYKFQPYFNHRRMTRRFLYHKTLLNFLEENPNASIYFTLNESVPNFQRIGDDFLINIDAYFRFCKSLQSNTMGRAKAFLGQHLKAKDVYVTKEEKAEFLKEHASDEKLIELAKGMSETSQKRIIDALLKLQKNTSTSGVSISKEDFISSFTKFLEDETVQLAFIQSLPQVQIETLKSHKFFLEKNLDKNETFFQNWIDEEHGAYRKQRCLIFGLEFIDHKTEGELSSKRFDILTRQSQNSENEYVLIELKSPSENVFDINETANSNGGKSVEYELSPSLARAIPQILNYKYLFENATDEELKKIDVRRGKIRKCLIIIGTSVDDDTWQRYFADLNAYLNIQVLTYTSLIEKLGITIKNLEENL